jgi:hypothetical protein
MAVARLDPRAHAPMDAAAMGAAGLERASPDPGGQSARGAAAQDGARPGAPAEPIGAPLAAHGRADRPWRPNVQRPRAGQGLHPTACVPAGTPADGCGAGGADSPMPAWPLRASAREGGALAVAQAGPERGADDQATRARAMGRRATASAGKDQRDGGVVSDRPTGPASAWAHRARLQGPA